MNTSLATANASLGNLNAAKELLAEALATQPDYLPALLADIRETAANKDLLGARSKIDALLLKNPSNPEALLIKGGYWALMAKPTRLLQNTKKPLK